MTPSECCQVQASFAGSEDDEEEGITGAAVPMNIDEASADPVAAPGSGNSQKSVRYARPHTL